VEEDGALLSSRAPACRIRRRCSLPAFATFAAGARPRGGSSANFSRRFSAAGTMTLAGVKFSVLPPMAGVSRPAPPRRLAAPEKTALIASSLGCDRGVILEPPQDRAVVRVAPGCIAVVRGPNHVFEIANAAYRRLAGRDDLIGRRAADALPELAEQGYLDLLDKVYASGEPFFAEAAPRRLRARAGPAAGDALHQLRLSAHRGRERHRHRHLR
jgi:hypothetical protein